MKRAALGGLQLSEGINKPPQDIEAGGIAWWHITGQDSIRVELWRDAGRGRLPEVSAPCMRTKSPSMKTSLQRRVGGGSKKATRERLALKRAFFLCLSPGSDYSVRLKVLREHVYQFKLQSMIITPRRTQCQVPEWVKAVIISKKRTMQEIVSLLDAAEQNCHSGEEG